MHMYIINIFLILTSDGFIEIILLDFVHMIILKLSNYIVKQNLMNK